ncbi:DUF4136 domain-containing protein [Novosphingobium sp. Chol11]|uniref:DUF4136 domain-containing protein n=1 Tax=Novosphingobium sp. Chol11 TaxID=1385763 RepID=UPI0025E10159|nr:DUF4136 domain-containing protein [Novosphingobium sp. Chol11]
MTMKTKFSRLALLAVPLALSLSACATNFRANVSRFQAELPAPAGQTFAIVAQDPRDQGGLEFSQYASLIAARMQRLGYNPGTPDSADLIVKFYYGVDQGRDRLQTTGFAGGGWGGPWGAGLGPWGGGFGRWGGGFGGPWGGGFGPWGGGFGPWGGGFGGWGGGFNDVNVVTIFTSGIDLKIDRRADGKRLFEGKAEAASSSNRLPYLVPNLVEAMFTGFPGNNGETVRISVAPEKKK